MEVDPAREARPNAPHGGSGRAENSLADLARRLSEERRSYREVGHAFSDLADATTIRLLERGEERLGPPPVPYAWIAAGSQGRREMALGSDQDNGLVLDDAFREGPHGDYFKALGAFVCEGLAGAGYPLCPGGMMATTERWRQPLSVWLKHFAGWIEAPDPKALMQASSFFDLRLVHGAPSLTEPLHGFVLDRSTKNSIFLAHLALNASSRLPPIGIFRRFVLIRGGEHDRTLDLKHKGVVPIIELARLYALSAGIRAANTFERLAALREAGILSRARAAELENALELIGSLRFRHQMKLMEAGRKPDSYVRLEELSSDERGRLKAAFAAVKAMQAAMAAAFRPGLPG